MANKITLIFFVVIIFLISENVQCNLEKIKFYLTNYEISKVTNIEQRTRLKLSSIGNERIIKMKALGKTFIMDLSIYYPKEDAAVFYISKLRNNSDTFLGSGALLYHGQVRDVKDSFVLGYFYKNNQFQGYVITDEVYCIEPYDTKGSVIVYRFKDVIVPGCSKRDDGKKLDCTETMFFNPWKANKPPQQRKSSTYSLFYDKYLQYFSSLQAKKAIDGTENKHRAETTREINGTDIYKSHPGDNTHKINDTDMVEMSDEDDKNNIIKHGDTMEDNKDHNKDGKKAEEDRSDTFVRTNNGDFNADEYKTGSSHRGNKTRPGNSNLDEKKKGDVKNGKGQRKTDTKDKDDDDDDEDDDLFSIQDNFEYQIDPIQLNVNSTTGDKISGQSNSSDSENNMNAFLENFRSLVSLDKWKELFVANEKLEDKLEKKEEDKGGFIPPIIEALENKAINLQCDLQIVVDPTLSKKFNNEYKDLIKNIYIQFTLLNKIFGKVFLERKKIPFLLHFNIMDIKIYGDEVYSPFTSDGDVEFFAKSHRPKEKSCFTIGLVNKALKSGQLFDGYIPKGGGGVCSSPGNIVIASHGTANNTAPMALFFAAVLRGVTRGLGANDASEKCNKGSYPNPMQVLQDYLLGKQKKPGYEYSIFTQCNIQEIASALKPKECLLKIDNPLCGNAIVDKGEECDCGPSFRCDMIDPCCTPPLMVARQKPKTEFASFKKGCTLIKGAKCATTQECCSACDITKSKKLCYTGKGVCDMAICDGISGKCPSGVNASNGLICSAYNESKQPLLCKDMKCERPLCSGFGLKPCTCAKGTQRDCVYCCVKDGKCQAAGSELKLMKDRGFFLPNGVGCDGGICTNGKCIPDTGLRPIFNYTVLKPPRFPVLASDGTAFSRTHSIIGTMLILLILYIM